MTDSTFARLARRRPAPQAVDAPRRAGLVALVALLVLASAAPAAVHAQTTPPPVAQPTALLVSAIGAPLRVPGSDGMAHVEYDLLVANVFTAPVTLTAVEVLAFDAPDRPPLLRLEGNALAALTQSVSGGRAPSTAEVPAAGLVATVIDLVVPPDAVPARLTHRIDYTLPPDAPALALIGSRRIDGPELDVDPREPVVLAPPLRGAGWFAASGCCLADGYVAPHRSGRMAVDGVRYLKNEAFAVDWVRLREGRFAEGDGGQNEQHFAFGAEVVAAGAGTVVAVRDGAPEGTPFRLPTTLRGPGDYSGNKVVVQQELDVFATYAHLQPGSMPVRVGDRVSAGQPLGRVGNTGNSFAPHLHFQLSDGPDLTTATSLPFVLDRFDLAGAVALDALVAALTDPGVAPAMDVAGPNGPQTGTHPLLLAVADFR
jgi:Peptidase family M23